MTEVMDIMPTVCVIEDISEMANLVALYLSKAGMSPRTFGTAEEALKALTSGELSPDIIILDLNLPGMSGFDLLKRITENHLAFAPVIILSARDDDEDIIKGLGLGADEFVTKPFSPKVLVARVMSHLRRQAAGAHQREDAVQFGEYTLLLDSCVLKKGNVKVPLSNKEYAVLECMVHHKDEALTPEKIYNEVWGAQYGDITAVAVYVGRLRRKIEADPAAPRYLKTIFGKGYMFATDESGTASGGSKA